MSSVHSNSSEGLAWREYLKRVFPGYLLPEAMRHAIDPEAAATFLRRLGGLASHRDLLRRASLILAHITDLHALCRHLDDLVRALPSSTHVARRDWEGRFHGPLDIPATTAHRMVGRPTRFVTRSRMRSFDRPENVLVRGVSERLLEVLVSLREADILGGAQKTPVLACENELRRLLNSTVLREVPLAKVDGYQIQAASAARHACYECAIAWLHWIEVTLERRDDQEMARILAEGALRPLKEPKQFEIAVLVRLIERIDTCCQRRSVGWEYERSVVMKGRKEVARFVRSDGTCILVFYDMLPQGRPFGARDSGVRHYFGSSGRLRPDITVVVEIPRQPWRAVVMETKLSEKVGTVSRGYGEAILYRHEYAEWLLDWPKAILICSRDIDGDVSTEHEVVAVDWRRWVPDALVEAIVPK